MKKFNGKVNYRKITGGNSGESFENARRGHYGGSDASYLCGVNEYGSTLEFAAKKAQIVGDSVFAKKTRKIFAIGHKRELEIAETCVEFMKIDSGFDIDLYPCDDLEWTNDEWPDALAHLDFIIEVKKGKVIQNPQFSIGCGKNNWVIVPDKEDHRYVADSKTCQSTRVPTWSERNDEGVIIGGLSNGVCPVPYWYQLHFYMTVCNIDGGFIFGSTGSNKVEEYAQVYVPYNPEAGQRIMDTCQKMFDLAKSGKIPKLDQVEDREQSALYLDKIYTKANEKLCLKKLTNKKYTSTFQKVEDINKEIDNLRESIKEEQHIVDTTNAKIARLRQQRKALLFEPMEEIKGRKGCYFTDEYGNTSVVEYIPEMKWDYLTKEYFEEHAPDVYKEAEEIFSQKKVKYTLHRAVQDDYDEDIPEID